MSVPNNTAGLISKFGQTKYISMTGSFSNGHRLPPAPKSSKFFKSRNLKDRENVIEETIEEEEETESASDEQDVMEDNLLTPAKEDAHQTSSREEDIHQHIIENEGNATECFSSSGNDDAILKTPHQPTSCVTNIDQSLASGESTPGGGLYGVDISRIEKDCGVDGSGSDMSLCNSGNNSLNDTVVPASTPFSCLPAVTPGPSNSTVVSSCSKEDASSSRAMVPPPTPTWGSAVVSHDAMRTPMSTKKAKSNIKVAVRCRPLIKRELKQDEISVVDIKPDQVIVALTKTFRFDINLDTSVGQERVYSECVQPLVQKVLFGYNASVFAYGQTGTGKTHTMGTDCKKMEGSHVGIIPRAIKDVFAANDNISVKVSFYEILNEQVFDLLNPSKQRVPLAVREVPNLSTFRISDLTQTEAHSCDVAMALLQEGTQLRTTESTTHNQASSRSHAVFTLAVSSETESGDVIIRKLNLVDLAGSEAVGSMKTVPGIRTQGIHINKGLLNLGNVVRALAEKKTHIPYRDSVLTKVLKESLQDTSFVSMIACISPAKCDMNETINTLRFANKAKELVSKPVPAFLLESNRMSAAKKRKCGELISETPKPRFNQTIHTGTPSKMKKPNSYKRQLNMTIGTPDKGRTPNTLFGSNESVSRMIEDSPDSPTFSNISGISMIKPPDDSNPSGRIENTTISLQDISSVISPYMHKWQESIAKTISEEMQKIKTSSKENVVGNTTTPEKKRNTPRMTSSPIRRTPLRKALAPSNSFNEDAEPLKEITNNTNKSNDDVIPEIPVYDSPASTAPPPPATTQKRSPTIEELERSLGIGPESPNDFLFCGPPADGSRRGVGGEKKRRESRRSSRRTSMIGSELEASLQFIREANAAKRRVSERPTRAAAQGVFYGSPSSKRKADDTSDKGGNHDNIPAAAAAVSHPLLSQNTFSVDPGRQHAHNQSILTLLNTGSLKLLTALPAIGPKTGLIIHGYRSLNGEIKSIRELETINGLGPRFYSKFLVQNQISLSDDE